MASLQNGHSFTLDPTSLILFQFSNNSDQPHLLQLEPQSPPMERGPRYEAYAALRESMLRMKRMKQSIPEEDYEEEEEEEYGLTLTPPKKQVKFQAPPSRRPKGSSSVLAQSVPDFSSAMRKENRKPPPLSSTLSTLMEKSLTPPPPVKPRMLMGKLSGSGSKSVNSGDKRGMMTRKSYASLEGLRGLASDARSSINAENRGSSRIGRGIGKTILGYSRQY